MTQIIPAILAITEDEYKDKLTKIEKSGLFTDQWVQIDFMDNKFVQNKSISPDVVSKYPTKLKLEAHLMVQYADSWIEELVKTDVERIVFHIDEVEGIDEKIAHIRNHGKKVGLAINPETDIEKLEPFVAKIDLVLILSVHPGFGGQDFIEDSIDKVKKLKGKRWPVKIEVDGGINEDVALNLSLAGADYLVVGTYLLEGNIDENLEKIWERIHS